MRNADHDGSLELGWSAIDTGDYDKALTLSTVILEADPDCPEAHNLRGNVLAVLGNHSRAIDGFYKAVELNPTTRKPIIFVASVTGNEGLQGGDP